MTPIRIQRQRTKGWKMPANTVYVGRPTKWGNPYAAKVWGSVERAVGQYRKMLSWPEVEGSQELRALLPELRGKNLACWCPLDQPCHADVLLELANSGAEAPHTPQEAK